MKRMHVHVAVENLHQSIGFYSALFDANPAVVKPDYAKWMLDDPRVNFAISTRGREPGLDHLGIQVEDKIELHEVYARLRKAGGTVIEQGETACCYAKSEKSWIDDPAGISWETFHTTGEINRVWRWHRRARGTHSQRQSLLCANGIRGAGDCFGVLRVMDAVSERLGGSRTRAETRASKFPASSIQPRGFHW